MDASGRDTGLGFVTPWHGRASTWRVWSRAAPVPGRSRGSIPYRAREFACEVKASSRRASSTRRGPPLDLFAQFAVGAAEQAVTDACSRTTGTNST